MCYAGETYRFDLFRWGRTALVLVLFLFITSTQAGLSLTKVPNWTAHVPAGMSYKLFPNATSLGTVILRRSGTEIIAMQPNVDTPIFSVPIPTGPYGLSDITFGDFDHDSQPDIAIAFIRTDRPDLTVAFDSLVAEIHCIRLSDGVVIDTIHWSIPQAIPTDDCDELDRYWGGIRLASIDFTKDGFTDLAINVSLTNRETDFCTFMYFRDDEERHSSVLSQVPGTPLSGVSGFATIALADGQRIETYEFVSLVSGNGSCCSPRGGTSSGYTVYNTQRHNVLFSLPDEPSACDDPCHGACSHSEHNTLLAYGDISPSFTSQQLLVTRTLCNDCNCNSITMLVRLDSSGTTSLIWSRDPAYYSGINNMTYSTALPGHFVGIGNDKRVYLYDGTNGNFAMQSTESFTGTFQGWYDMYGDGEMYMLTQSDTTLSLYRVGLSVDANDPETILLPNAFTLSAPYPNPFNPTVSFALSIPTKSKAEIAVFDLLGRRIKTIFEGNLSAGTQTFTWDGSASASGVYFIHAKIADGPSLVRKAILIK